MMKEIKLLSILSLSCDDSAVKGEGIVFDELSQPSVSLSFQKLYLICMSVAYVVLVQTDLSCFHFKYHEQQKHKELEHKVITVEISYSCSFNFFYFSLIYIA